MEQRRFHRVKHSSPGELKHHEMIYRCRVENISLRGALISADECLMVPLNESCTLSVDLAEGERPMTITVSVVHCFFSMMGVKFVDFKGDAEQRLFDLINRITPEPDTLAKEWEALQHERSETTAPEPAIAAL